MTCKPYTKFVLTIVNVTVSFSVAVVILVTKMEGD